MALNIPNTNRIRATADTTIANAVKQTQQYVNRNVPQVAGTRVAVPKIGSRHILPVAK